MSASSGTWNFYIDRGGTFTDVVAQAPDGALSTLKLLSESSRYDDAALEGIRRALGLENGAAIPPGLVGEVRMGTTVATNALLTRGGARVVLVTTKGLGDQLRIGYQNRPKLFALKIELPDMLYEGVIEAEERMTAQGATLTQLDEVALARDLTRRGRAASRPAPSCSCTAIAFRHTSGGRREIARACGFTQISTSHEAVPLMKFVSRGDTTVADAYLSPVLARYTQRIADALAGANLTFMTSNGGLAAPRSFAARTRSFRALPAAWSAWWRRRARRGSPKSSASTWGHLDRRGALRRRL